ncbi:MAG: hypothetical protein L3J24_00905 [Xanthomonadales bacterium]|nr:hypothetical protein [Xanthomonadales bacterium]
MYVPRLFLFTIVLFITPLSVNAASYVIDQQQPLINESAGFLGVGSDSEQKLAQTFTVGMDGDLAGLRIPVAGCGRGDLLIQLTRQVDGRPTGLLLRALIVFGSDVPSAYTGFTDFFFPTPVGVSVGDKLAFSVQTIGVDSYCSYATAPAGDTYSRGDGFFDSRPNPPGWLSFKGVPDRFNDLAFFTLMEDRSISGRSGNCLIPGRTDPITGLPLELPISNLVPACRCFEDAGAREMRCGILHPDFFIVREFPVPLLAGKEFKERWKFTPLTKLDGPVRISISGGALQQPIKFEFVQKFGKKEPETFTFKAIAPIETSRIQGSALIEYDMQDAKSEYQRSFGVDTSINPDQLKK